MNESFIEKLSFLKVLTNEKRDGLNLVSFDWSRFKLFVLKFSKKSVQTPSCERPKTAQRTLFLSFEINNCFPITVKCRAASPFSHHTLNWNNGFVLSNVRNRLRWAVLGLSQDGFSTDSFENFSVKSLKRDQSNDIKFYPPFFSLVNTFKSNWVA